MDPNANLSEQSYLLGYGRDIDSRGRARMKYLRLALTNWLNYGGFEPSWTDYPVAAANFRQWQRRCGLIERGKVRS